jgi:hypothetical protein
MLSAALIDALLAETFSPTLEKLGFVVSGRRRWVREHQPVRQLVSIVAFKGASFRPTLGLSFDFVPHVAADRVQWHRTNDRAVFDLRYDAIVHGRGDDLSALAEPEEFRRKAQQLAARTARASTEWFAGEYEPADLVRRFETESARQGGFEFELWYQQPLALAFVLARAGQFDEARVALGRWCDRHASDDRRATEKLRERLHLELERIAGQRDEK